MSKSFLMMILRRIFLSSTETGEGNKISIEGIDGDAETVFLES